MQGEVLLQGHFLHPANERVETDRFFMNSSWVIIMDVAGDKGNAMQYPDDPFRIA